MVFTVNTATSHPQAVENRIDYEHRIGKRAQYEIGVPFNLQQDGDGQWSRGLGDVNAGVQVHVLRQQRPRLDRRRRRRGHAADRARKPKGLGGGVTIFEAFGMFDQALPRDGFVQFHAGFERPANHDVANNSVYWRTAVGKTFKQNRWGRIWTPMVEVLGDKELEEGDEGGVGLVPQMQVSLSIFQHVLLSVGVPGAGQRARHAQQDPAWPISCGTGSTAAVLDVEGTLMRAGCRRWSLVPLATAVVTLGLADTPRAAAGRPDATSRRVIAMHADPDVLFKTGGNCMPCHNSLITPSGEDVSIGVGLARDDDGQLGARSVLAGGRAPGDDRSSERRARTSRTSARSATCRWRGPLAHANRRKGRGLRASAGRTITQRPDDLLAHDGVSCAMCHQISSEKLGTRESFVGGFVVAGPPADASSGLRSVRGREGPDDGHAVVG